jgi:protein subunit release factor B
MDEPKPKIFLPRSDEELLKLCEIQTYRSSGSGGQHVNTTDSAVRLIYLPHRIVITCQKERSQYLNKMECLKKLREKVAIMNYRKPKRVPTRISKSQKEKNLNKKTQQGAKKKLRGKLDWD